MHLTGIVMSWLVDWFTNWRAVEESLLLVAGTQIDMPVSLFFSNVHVDCVVFALDCKWL